METLAGPNLLRMVHTRHGAAAAIAVITYGTARNRKAVVKAFSGVLECRYRHRACVTHGSGEPPGLSRMSQEPPLLGSAPTAGPGLDVKLSVQ